MFNENLQNVLIKKNNIKHKYYFLSKRDLINNELIENNYKIKNNNINNIKNENLKRKSFKDIYNFSLVFGQRAV